MNHFTTDDRYFAKYYTKYGVIPTDEELPYKASDNSASGKYVHPDDDNNKGKSNKHMKQKQTKQTIKLNESQLRNMIKESITNCLNEWGFPDNMDYNVERPDTAMDELQKYSDADIKSSYDPSDIVDAFRNMAKSSDNIEFVISIGQALLSEDGLTEKDGNRRIEGLKQDYELARTRIQNILNKFNKNFSQPS